MKILKRKTLAALLAFSLLASLLPLGAQPALAADGDQTVYVGGVALTYNESTPVYATTDESGNVSTEGASADNYNIKWDGNTLTLKNAYITNAAHGDSYLHPVEGAAIGVANSSGGAELTIQLESGNTIEDVSLGIWVYSSGTGDASLTITGDGNLTASGSVNPGILVQSNDGNATLSIENAEVTTTSSSYCGVQVRAKDSSNASLTVNGGSLTATCKSEHGAGIQYTFGSSSSGSGKPSLTVSNSAIVKASGDTGGITSNSSPVTPSGAGIVFNNGTGTVYGDVTLQENITINEGESLSLSDGASLNADGHNVIVDGGTLDSTLATSLGNSVIYKVTSVSLNKNNLTLDVGKSETLTATITPSNATNQNVTWESSDSNGIVTISPDTADSKNATITATGAGTTTIKATADGKSAECSVTVKAPTTIPVTGVSLNKASTTLTVGDTETLTATVAPEDATNKAVTWSSNDSTVVTVDESGKVTAVAPGEATITVTTEDGSKTANCAVTVYAKTAITTQPQSVSVTEGQSATFSVTASGDNLRYQWQINSGNGWSAITGATDASYTIDRTTTAMSGNQYRCIVTGDGGETTSSAATLTVRSYEPPYTGKYSYEIVSDVGENGTIDVDRYATEGDQVTITVSPDEAYLLDDLTVTSGGKDVALTDNGDGTYTFTMPSADVKISATFAEDPDWTEPEEPATDVSDIFLDIAPNAWYKDAVQYAYAGGLMTGVSANEFAPEQTTTRAETCSMLARLEGVESAESAGFADVAANDWYATAVNWAAASGITSGTGDGNFSPNTAITREQLAAILMNYAQYKGQDVSARATLDTYNDATAISSWANDVMSWAVAEGLLTGVTADTLQPQGNATRAQVAAILERFLDN
ncbi:MAG: S-layer homology domain-containing protein [Peptococcaceae bacterium]|nr:S-layer homology domain-containing protein [Peptococcaceae bacterium]